MAVLASLTTWIFPIRCFGSTATSFSFFSDCLRFLVKFFLESKEERTTSLHAAVARTLPGRVRYCVRVILALCFVV